MRIKIFSEGFNDLAYLGLMDISHTVCIHLSIVVELGQEVYELVLIPEQDIQDRFRLVGICNKHLERIVTSRECTLLISL